MQYYFHNYRYDLIYHLKHGPVKITLETAAILGIDGPCGSYFQMGTLKVRRFCVEGGKLTLVPDVKSY